MEYTSQRKKISPTLFWYFKYQTVTMYLFASTHLLQDPWVTSVLLFFWCMSSPALMNNGKLIYFAFIGVAQIYP